MAFMVLVGVIPTLMGNVESASVNAMGEAKRKRDLRASIPSGPKCDFCVLPPAWMFPTRRFPQVILGHRFEDDKSNWAACQRCSEILESGDINTLANRAVDFYQRRLGGANEPQLLIALHQLFSMVEANRIGPKVAWTG